MGAQPFYYRARDPTVLVGGIGPGWPEDYFDPLRTRLGIDIIGTPQTSSGDERLTSIRDSITTAFRETTREEMTEVFKLLLDEFEALNPAKPGVKITRVPKTRETERKPSATVEPPQLERRHPQYHHRDIWNGQPWRPLYLEWEVEYWHVPFDLWSLEERAARLSDNRQVRYSIDGSRTLWDEMEKNQKPFPSKKVTLMNDTRIISGRVLILPQPGFSLQIRLQQLFANTPKSVLDGMLPEEDRQKLMASVSRLPFLSAPLSGLTENLLTISQGTHIKPENQETADKGEDIFTVIEKANFDDAGLIRENLALIQGHSGLTPFAGKYSFLDSPYHPFKPCYGFRKLNIIDKFGQTLVAIDPSPSDTGFDPIYPCISDFFEPGTIKGEENELKANAVVKDNPGLCQFRERNKLDTDAYAGTLILGYEPYLLQATGTYQTINLDGGKSFGSLFVHARLQGPLMTIGYAEISGVQGGFGYNSAFRTPRIQEINEHYFSPKTVDLGTLTAATLHQTMQDIVKPGGWFEPKEDSSWVAAGLSIKAFQMISLSAVLALELNSSITITVLAIGTVDIPSSQAKLKFAHVELGFQAVVEVDNGTLLASAELLPGSFILHPDCHLTGGFGLAYWFDGPKADKSRVGEYVFTLGGYHKAFDSPKDYPKPPRLAISWTISSSLSIRGEAYFAINPKACMAGGRLHASLDKGWFEAVIHINAGIGYTLGKGILAVSGSLEVGAELTLWGPPLAGRPSLLDFYRTALQIKDSNEEKGALDHTRPKNEGHIFRVLSGLVNGEEPDNPEEEIEEPNGWIVQGGTLSLLVACKIPIQTLDIAGVTALKHDTLIYAKPMRGTEPLTSKGTVDIKVSDGTTVKLDEWILEKQLGPAPKALWDKYDPGNDPVHSGHGTKELLDSKAGNVKLITGFTLRAPKPQMSPDKLAKILHHDGTEGLQSEFPKTEEASKEWLPASRKEGREQWIDVHDAWSRRKPPIMEPDSPQTQGQQQGQQQGQASSLQEAPTTPHNDHNAQGSTATQFVATWESSMNWEQGTLSKFATMPKQMDDRFMRLFAVAPSISV
ncbi:hypothetical protein N8T08_000692 [Aspergillus melleus]|uniref:Uncharacterized protein n=1 Tax=Aspergillus melleus TaxID=138277 RepID=A0ACC3APJ4_9EURO|nr:hypothetical protein N8T08_000692 [Aspergillus melleus]